MHKTRLTNAFAKVLNRRATRCVLRILSFVDLSKLYNSLLLETQRIRLSALTDWELSWVFIMNVSSQPIIALLFVVIIVSLIGCGNIYQRSDVFSQSIGCGLNNLPKCFFSLDSSGALTWRDPKESVNIRTLTNLGKNITKQIQEHQKIHERKQ